MIVMNNYYFTEMTEDYLEDVLQIYTHYVLHTTATFHTQPLTRGEMKEMVCSPDPKYKTFVLLDKNRVSGYVLLTRHKPREAYDETAEVTIYLDPSCKTKGLGSLALSHIEEYARTQPLHTLVATICGQNEASIRLFEKNGYTKCAHYKEVGKKFGQRLDILGYQKIIP
jgi:phosphinothricin acetyltransferase